MKKYTRGVLAAVALVLLCHSVAFAQGGSGPVPALVNGQRLDRRLGNQLTTILTNAQVLALCTTPVQVIPAFGTGTTTEVTGGVLSYSYTGAYTSVSGNNLKLYSTDRTVGPALTPTMTMLGFLDATAAKILSFGATPADELLTTNAAVVIQNVNGTCYGGGNSANTLTVRVNFIVYNR